MRRIRFLLVAWVIALGSGASWVQGADAPDTEKADVSKVTGVTLPAGAMRLLSKETIERTSALLKAGYADAQLSGYEILLWDGNFSGDPGDRLRRDARSAIEKKGFEYKEAHSDEKPGGGELYLCSAVTNKRRILGMWFIGSEGAILVWAEDLAAAKKAPAAVVRDNVPAPGEATFQNVVYIPPKGWTSAIAGDGVTLTPDGLDANAKMSVLILAGHEFAGNLDDAQIKLWNELCAEFHVNGSGQDKQELHHCFKGWDYVSLGGTVIAANSAHLFLKAWLIHVGNRLERVAVLTNLVGDDRETPFNITRYSREFYRFLFFLKFKNHTDPDLPTPHLVQGGLGGVWQGLKMDFDPGRSEMRLMTFTAAFYDNGMVFYSSRFGTETFASMDPYISRENSGRWWGTYTLKDHDGEIKLLYATIPMHLNSDTLVLTTNQAKHNYVRLPDVDNARFDGTWALGGKTIQFTADGHFSDQGVLGVLEHSLDLTHNVAAKPGKGTYEVKTYAVFFHYSDGREFSTAFLDVDYRPGDQHPRKLKLSFNSDELQRK